MEQSLQLINDFLDRLFIYGPIWIYLALFLAAFIENIFPPFPGDIFTLLGGAIAASGKLNVMIVFIMIYLGGILSILVLYYLGRNLGRDFFIRKNYKLLSRKDIDKLENWFARRGAYLLIFNRFIVGARAAVAVITGISRYNPVKMTILISISFWLFNGILLFSGYFFVSRFDDIVKYFGTYEKLAWPIVIITVIVFVVYKIKAVRKNGK